MPRSLSSRLLSLVELDAIHTRPPLQLVQALLDSRDMLNSSFILGAPFHSVAHGGFRGLEEVITHVGLIVPQVSRHGYR